MSTNKEIEDQSNSGKPSGQTRHLVRDTNGKHIWVDFEPIWVTDEYRGELCFGYLPDGTKVFKIKQPRNRKEKTRSNNTKKHPCPMCKGSGCLSCLYEKFVSLAKAREIEKNNKKYLKMKKYTDLIERIQKTLEDGINGWSEEYLKRLEKFLKKAR